MPTSWIYNLSKEELIRESRERKLPTVNLTVDKLRKQLSDHIREEEEETFEMTSEDQTRTASQLNLSSIVREWNISFDTACDPVEFIERLDELTSSGDVPQDRLLQVLPKVLRGKPLLWYRNNSDNWEKWEDFLKDFKLFFYPAGYEKNLLEMIIARKQHHRESFVNYLTDIQTLMRRYGKMSKTEKEERVYENMNANYKYYIKKQDFTSLGELIKQAAEYEQITEESSSQQWNHRPDRHRQTPKSHPETSPEPRKIHEKYDRTTCCWNCGKAGHSHKECRGRQVLFCSQCGVLGRLTRNCCRRETKFGDTNITAEENRPEQRIFEDVKIGKIIYRALVDTGSTRSYISRNIYEENSTNADTEKVTGMRVTVADGRVMDVKLRIDPEIEIRQRKITHELFVLPAYSPPNLVIIGIDLLRKAGATIVWNNNTENTPKVTEVVTNDSTPPNNNIINGPIKTKSRKHKKKPKQQHPPRYPDTASIQERKEWFERKMTETRKSPQNDPTFAIKNGSLQKRIVNPAYGVKINAQSQWKLCVPTLKRRSIIEQYLNEPTTTGYVTTGKILKSIAETYYWPGMYKDVLHHMKKYKERLKSLSSNSPQPYSTDSTEPKQ
ncbi:uncharacterized protein LOC125489469 [Plutella xylostella]|uniref:uncharacterized protein LOC125489468 n=1 Tax=Plutella xylostella TaxID=51655 RepID=UPI002032D11A|nr:uncharacterized protein LOC125489468 [Plutella xylostella]XP_048481356.1 uncharacterized protein LOC125489469 [Plutella xylostella]